MTFPGPTPLYSNPPINPRFYKPRRFVISNIILGITTLVSSLEKMDYKIGQLVRLHIPIGYGTTQLDEVLSYVIEIPSKNSVLLQLDSSRNVNNFINANCRNKAQIVAIGDINTGYISSTGSYIHNPGIPGAFINISGESL